MRTFLEKKLGPKDKGFTLIELLVVIVIIGILAAIAIPIFLNQRKKAADASAKSDVRSVATQLESAFTDNNVYPTLGALPGAGGTYVIGSESVKLSPNNTIAEIKYNASTPATANAYCVRVVAGNGSTTTGFVWQSDAGGLQASSVTACPSATGWTVATPAP